MCGINAILDWKGALGDPEARVAAMNVQMQYRGPDGEGSWAEGPAALGMRRLSIIDLDGGQQPLFNEDRSLVLVCNGEIYNYLELRAGLEQAGHRFATGSDAETILHLYEEKGVDCLAELRGMFAFVLWDRMRRRVFAARDRIGIKPLYIGSAEGALFLSSELKAILLGTRRSPTLRPDAARTFLAFSYPLDPRHTLVEEITRLPPGEYLLDSGQGPERHVWWTPPFGGEQGIAPAEDEEVLATLSEAVDLHLRSDVPVGVLLSGGLDSSTLCALARNSNASCQAISAGYLGSHAEDERPVARRTAQTLGMDLLEVECAVTDFEADFEALVQVCDEPVGDIAAMAQWALYRRAREAGFKVLLTGLGGDEVFFGYPPWNALGESFRLPGTASRERALQVAQAFTRSLDPASTRVLAGPLRHAPAAAEIEALWQGVPPGPDEIAALLFRGYLVHNGCQLADKLGMGCSVEVRVPFLDHALVEKVLALPLSQRFDPTRTKPLLKRVMAGRLPEEITSGPKRGFAPPIGFIGELVERRIEQVLEGRLAQEGWVDRSELSALAREHRALPWLGIGRLRKWLGVPRHGWLLFRLVALDRWLELMRTAPARS